jgi:hypothetical protein
MILYIYYDAAYALYYLRQHKSLKSHKSPDEKGDGDNYARYAGNAAFFRGCYAAAFTEGLVREANEKMLFQQLHRRVEQVRYYAAPYNRGQRLKNDSCGRFYAGPLI